ncbi:MAG TPA: tripartite tricarboxylate transporter substrate binding protein [Xanthobacteraceae bacterium]|nr:tripartite tricarboxylate transporter substrate binding protein [Xanthobacteraceae bacterium]
MVVMRLRAALAVRLIACVAALLLAGTSAHAQAPAQAWPQRAVRFIVTLGPGSGVDIGARLLADRLPARWGKPVVVENRPGADSLVAIQAFVSAADDHVLLFTPAGNFTVHPLQYAKLPYVPEDLAPIARVSNTILAIGVPTSLKIDTLADFVKYARANPGKLNAAVVSGITEFTFDYFVKTAGLDIAKVPYRDIVQAATDLSEGRLQVMMSSYAILQPRVQAGSVKVLAVNGHERTTIVPGVPTARESGFPALEVEGLVGLFGPRTMPKQLREKIGADVAAAAGDPAIAERLAATAQVPNPGGPDELAAAVAAQRAQIATIAKTLGPIELK